MQSHGSSQPVRMRASTALAAPRPSARCSTWSCPLRPALGRSRPPVGYRRTRCGARRPKCSRLRRDVHASTCPQGRPYPSRRHGVLRRSCAGGQRRDLCRRDLVSRGRSPGHRLLPRLLEPPGLPPPNHASGCFPTSTTASSRSATSADCATRAGSSSAPRERIRARASTSPTTSTTPPRPCGCATSTTRSSISISTR